MSLVLCASGRLVRLLRGDWPSFPIRDVLPRLEVLRLAGIVLDHIDIKRRPCPLPRLESLFINTSFITPNSLHAILSGAGPGLTRLTVSTLWPRNSTIIDGSTLRSIHTLLFVGSGTFNDAPALQSWPSLRTLRIPSTFIRSLHALPSTVLRITAVSCQWRWIMENAVHSRIWNLASWVCRALGPWHASAPGLRDLRIVDEWCTCAELATWRMASFLLAERCSGMGVRLTVDVKVHDMTSVMSRSRIPTTITVVPV